MRLSLGRRTLVVAVLGAVWASVVIVNARAWDTNPLGQPVVRHDHHCGQNDHPERKLQGQVPKEDQASGEAKKGYNCGLSLVGFTPLDRTADGTDTRPNANANMAWAGRCAYVSGSDASLFNPPGVSTYPAGTPGGPGVAVVDVHDPSHPAMVRVLRDPGAVAVSETINAVTKPDGIAILVVGQYGNDPVSDPKPMDIYIYDTSDPDCSHLQHLPNATDPAKATYDWPGNIHNLTISPDGNYVYATIPIQAIDISGIWGHLDDPDVASHIRYVGDLNKSMNAAQQGVGPQNDIVPAGANPTHPLAASNSHEAWVEDDNTLYIGGVTAFGEMLTIVDVSQWLTGTGPARVISQTAGRGHSVRTATIGGEKYLLHSEESVFGTAYGCIPQAGAPFAGPAQPWLTNIHDPAHPVLVSQMGLEINEPAHCSTQMDDGENDSVHYHDVDDPQDTHFVMASMWNAGIRIFDVRNPTQPTEVAYFNSADVAPAGQSTVLDQVWGHVRYDAATGNIWFASANGGFFVVQLENQVRQQLGLAVPVPPLPGVPQLSGVDAGWPGTTGITYAAPLAAALRASAYYCTLAPATAAAAPG